jgi:hypothetical protein
MCLDRVQVHYDPPEPVVRAGWKVIQVLTAGWVPPILRYGIISRAYDAWVEAQDDIFNCGMRELKCAQSLQSYKPGFHIFRSKQAAERWRRVYALNSNYYKVVRVEYRDLTSIGKEGNAMVIVAQKIMIRKDQKALESLTQCTPQSS